jgi:hypothetical protein
MHEIITQAVTSPHPVKFHQTHRTPTHRKHQLKALAGSLPRLGLYLIESVRGTALLASPVSHPEGSLKK